MTEEEDDDGELFLESVPEEFWETVEAAQQDPARLRGLLKQMSRDEIINFVWVYQDAAAQLRADHYWHYVDPDLSEDGLAELANWVVAQGRDYYGRVWEDAAEMPPRKNDAGLLRAAHREFKERFGEDIPLNRNEWDEQWRSHGKKGPYG